MGKWRYLLVLILPLLFNLIGNTQFLADPAGVIDIAADEQNSTIYGADNNDFSNPFLDGFNSLALGDINGDGIADLILGAPLADGPENRRKHAGEVYVIFGPLPAELDLARTEPDVTIIGAAEGDKLGVAVASGDLNSDGFDDIIIGAPAADSLRDERKDAGEVYIFFGGTGLNKTIDLAEVDPDAMILGADTGDNLGLALASGDINGDGLDDLIIGAPSADSQRNGRSGAGEAYVIFGGFSFTTIDLALDRPDEVIFGDDIGDHLGLGLAVGDVNGDGIGDLIIGAAAGDGPGNSRDNAGEVYVLYGSPDPPSQIDLASEKPAVTIWGARAGDRLGLAVAAGDTDGDGFGDVVVGAFAGDGLGGGRANAGVVYLVHGSRSLPPQLDLALEGADVIIGGADVGDNLGVSLALVDVDHDGKADIFIGAPGGDGPDDGRRNAGEAYLIFGSSLFPQKIDLANTQVDHVVIYGADPGDNLGISVAGGDLDGDGLGDLVVEAVNADGPGNRKLNSGEVYSVLGSHFAAPNRAPVADAGPDQRVTVGETVQLDGSGSRDPDGDPLSFYWEFVSRPEGSTATLSNPNIARPSFIADKIGEYVLQLTVDDGRGGLDTDQVKIVARAAPPSRLKGDVDLDGDVDIDDARLAAEYIVGLKDLTEEQRWAADVHTPCRPPDTNIDVTDVRWIMEFFLHLQQEMFCYETSPAAAALPVTVTKPSEMILIRGEGKRLHPGKTTKLKLIVANPGRVAGIQASSDAVLYFDPTVLQVEGIRALGDYQLLAAGIDNTRGEVRFVILAPERPLRRKAFAELEVKAQAVGESELGFTGLRLVDDAGHPLRTKSATLEIKVRQGVNANPHAQVRVSTLPGSHEIEFRALQAVQHVWVEVYDLAGRPLFTDDSASNVLRWTPTGLANGVYLYVFKARSEREGEIIVKVGKLVVLR